VYFYAVLKGCSQFSPVSRVYVVRGPEQSCIGPLYKKENHRSISSAGLALKIHKVLPAASRNRVRKIGDFIFDLSAALDFYKA